MALRDIIASVTAFLNCLRKKKTMKTWENTFQEKNIDETDDWWRYVPHGQVHGSDGKQRESVDLYHDGHEGDVEQNFDEPWGTKSAEKTVCITGMKADSTESRQQHWTKVQFSVHTVKLLI